MEVHVPEHPIHTWREFFSHIGIVTIGLLIAIAMEQGVEALHDRHQRNELREALQQDGERSVADTDRLLQNQHQRITWLNMRLAQVRTAIAEHKALAPGGAANFIDYDLPDMPVWHAARSAGTLELLVQKDLRAWSEVDLALAGISTSYPEQMIAVRKRRAFESQFSNQVGQPPLRPVPAELLPRYFDLLSEEAGSVFALQSDAAELKGAAEAVISGERDLDKIQDAERPAGIPVNRDRQQ
jgi:hypothetical protein